MLERRPVECRGRRIAVLRRQPFEKETNITKEDALNKLAECQKNCDAEMAHCDADDVLCALLEDLGYGDVVSEYDKVHKWFA